MPMHVRTTPYVLHPLVLPPPVCVRRQTSGSLASRFLYLFFSYFCCNNKSKNVPQKAPSCGVVCPFRRCKGRKTFSGKKALQISCRRSCRRKLLLVEDFVEFASFCCSISTQKLPYNIHSSKRFARFFHIDESPIRV